MLQEVTVVTVVSQTETYMCSFLCSVCWNYYHNSTAGGKSLRY